MVCGVNRLLVTSTESTVGHLSVCTWCKLGVCCELVKYKCIYGQNVDDSEQNLQLLFCFPFFVVTVAIVASTVKNARIYRN